MNPLTNADIAANLGLRLGSLQDSYLSDWNGLARLIRQSVYRRGIITRRELASDRRAIQFDSRPVHSGGRRTF